MLPKVLGFQYHIDARWVRTNFLQQFCHMKTDFYKRYKAGCSGKYLTCENLLHHCCEHYCQVKSNITDLFTTISSVFSSDGHLKPVCVCKFNLGSLHIIMNIGITGL